MAVIGLGVAATGFIDIDGSDARQKAEFDSIPYANRAKPEETTDTEKEES
jgi:hypothetical protein